MKALLLAACFVWMETCYAEDFICSDGLGKFQQYVHSIDPTRVPDKTNCAQVPEGEIPTQLAIIRDVPSKYLTLSGVLVAEMKQSDKDVVDAAVQAEQDAADAEEAARVTARQTARDDLLANGITQATIDLLIPPEPPPPPAPEPEPEPSPEPIP